MLQAEDEEEEKKELHSLTKVGLAATNSLMFWPETQTMN